ncbi:hypothetical protein K3495_g2056 [Podosphaera aphanis]|nr:hypothetical protein K3495_g2056 [Podosphaera aphanis]
MTSAGMRLAITELHEEIQKIHQLAPLQENSFEPLLAGPNDHSSVIYLIELLSAKDVFKMDNRHPSVGSFRSPPLKDPLSPIATPAVSLEDNWDVLSRNFLQNTPEANDIPLDSPAAGRTALPFPHLTLLEVKTSIKSASNTAPGEDEILTVILKKGWPLIEPLVFSLFKSCLQVRHYPVCFKRVILVMLSKPIKLNKDNPRLFRPIALLSVLGKGLERLVVAR